MFFFNKISFILISSLIISGCVNNSYAKEQSVLIIFKTPTFKYADLGFIYKNQSQIKAQIYGSGQSLMSLKIFNNSVCMSLLECMSSKEFNKRVLNSIYPDNILDNIFRGKEIWNSRGLKREGKSFIQTIELENQYDITYSVNNKETIFRDNINNILIKIRKMD